MAIRKLLNDLHSLFKIPDESSAAFSVIQKFLMLKCHTYQLFTFYLSKYLFFLSCSVNKTEIMLVILCASINVSDKILPKVHKQGKNKQ